MVGGPAPGRAIPHVAACRARGGPGSRRGRASPAGESHESVDLTSRVTVPPWWGHSPSAEGTHSIRSSDVGREDAAEI